MIGSTLIGRNLNNIIWVFLILIILLSCGSPRKGDSQSDNTNSPSLDSTRSNSGSIQYIPQPHHLQNLEGIWIAEDYYDAFEKTRSALLSKEAFFLDLPVALRINWSELKDSLLNVGFSTLNEYSFYPEVSKYKVVGKDTFFEENNFQIHLKDSWLGDKYLLPKIPKLNTFNPAYLSWTDGEKPYVIIQRPKTANQKEIELKYIRVFDTFSSDLPYPNPLYHYNRSRTFSGSFTLLDSSEQVLSPNINIGLNGRVNGFPEFERKVFYLRTGLYGGFPCTEDIVWMCEDVNFFSVVNCKQFLMIQQEEGVIHLFSWRGATKEEADQKYHPNKLLFTLIPR